MRRTAWWCLLVLMLPLCAPSPVAAAPVIRATFYISPTGSDTNTGRDVGRPWRTFANIDRAPAGASILLRAGGVWHGTVTAPQARMIFGVYGSGARPKVIAPAGRYAFDAAWRPAVSIRGWELTGETRTSGANGLLSMTSDGYAVADIVVHGVDHQLALFQGYGGSVSGGEFYDCNGAGGDACVQVIGHIDGSATEPAEMQTVGGNHFHDTSYRAFSTIGTMVAVAGNTFARWATVGPGDANNAPAGIYVTGYAPVGTVTVTGNTFTGTGAEGVPLWVDTGPAGVVVMKNSVANARFCFYSEKTNGTVFTGNTCRNIIRTGVLWGNAPPEGPPSVGGTVSGNFFTGPTPTQGGWIVVFPGSSASIKGNVTGLH